MTYHHSMYPSNRERVLKGFYDLLSSLIETSTFYIMKLCYFHRLCIHRCLTLGPDW